MGLRVMVGVVLRFRFLMQFDFAIVLLRIRCWVSELRHLQNKFVNVVLHVAM